MTLSNSIIRTILFPCLISGCVALAALTSAPSFAADGDTLPQAAFSVRGVDFTSPHAVAHIKRRLASVARGMCVQDVGGLHLISADERACYETAVRDGLAQIDGRAQQAMRDRALRLADAAG